MGNALYQFKRIRNGLVKFNSNGSVVQKVSYPGQSRTPNIESIMSVREGVVVRLDFPGVVQEVYIRSERRKDSPRGTTSSRPPSAVPRATLLFD
ncbi:hypothetical protein TNCV_4292551 [Trichonephila clavipes]|uniref:Uncharacterized protein n=1 Tax=Trichonephila clavipes TaxID=2585209 RepID=A0A8X6RHG1_TRICX|nr:hypothetical protein TNCV_4292551 [Trichonephila clavipes]